MVCDLCGKDAELFTTNVEASVMNVCQSCSAYGKVIQRAHQPAPKIHHPETPQLLPPSIISGIHKEIKQARERKGLTQKELASQLKEKESLIQKVEGGFEPSIALAQKLEKALQITILEEGTSSDPVDQPATDQGALTIGDLIKVKKS